MIVVIRSSVVVGRTRKTRAFIVASRRILASSSLDINSFAIQHDSTIHVQSFTTRVFRFEGDESKPAIVTSLLVDHEVVVEDLAELEERRTEGLVGCIGRDTAYEDLGRLHRGVSGDCSLGVDLEADREDEDRSEPLNGEPVLLVAARDSRSCHRVHVLEP